MSLAKSVLSTLRERKETIAVAESVTGGGISNAITEVEGASHSFLGGVVAYSRESKVRDLSIAENPNFYNNYIVKKMRIKSSNAFDLFLGNDNVDVLYCCSFFAFVVVDNSPSKACPKILEVCESSPAICIAPAATEEKSPLDFALKICKESRRSFA